MEYEYAVAKGKPTIAFLYKDLGRLAPDKTELDDAPRQKLEAFREAAKARHCKMWDSRDSLAKAVYQAVHYLMQEKPSSGWVRPASGYDEHEMLTLKNRILQLENELQPLRLAGLVNAGTSPYTVDWSALFAGARKLDILFAYGRTWRHSRLVDLTAFARTPNNRLRVVLPDPGNESVVSDLSRRFSCAPAELQGRIREAAGHFLSFKDLPDSKAEIAVWYYPFAPTYTLYRFDDSAVVALYSHRSMRGGVVTLLIRGGVVASYMQDEFKCLLDDGHARAVTETDLTVQAQEATV